MDIEDLIIAIEETDISFTQANIAVLRREDDITHLDDESVRDIYEQLFKKRLVSTIKQNREQIQERLKKLTSGETSWFNEMTYFTGEILDTSLGEYKYAASSRFREAYTQFFTDRVRKVL